MSFVLHINAPALEMLLREILQLKTAQDERLARIEGKLGSLITNGVKILATVDDLKKEVEAEGTVIASAVTLLNGLSQQLKDALAANDPKAIQAVIDAMEAQKQSLAEAVVNNTPAADPVPVEVPPSA